MKCLRCVGGPRDGLMIRSEHPFIYARETEPIPVAQWREMVSRNPGVASVWVVTHIYEYHKTSDGTEVWLYKGKQNDARAS